ncbi:MAG: TonB-dependent receptor [Calditrichaeota bacterium]|nr:MAG: TonB-dependent receptor [Calditrichota bacterium]
MRLAYGRFHQGLATSLEDGELHFMPLLFPTENEIPVEESDHFIAGVSVERSRVSLKADVYYKRFSGLLEAKNSVPEFKQGSGRAYGLELTLKRPGDRLNLELNYALSYSQRHFDGVTYFTSFDQRDAFSLFGRYALGKNWQLNFRWVLSTGRPFTPGPVLFADRIFDPVTGAWLGTGFVRDVEINNPQRKNRARFPVYHRLDMSFMKRIQKRGWAIIPYIQVLNVYFRRNVLFYDWDLADFNSVKRKSFPMMPIVPTLGVSLEF